MKILLWSHSFSPAVGGIETVSAMLADEFTRAGHDLTVVTNTGASTRSPDRYAFPIVRRPDNPTLFRLVDDCDAYLQNHISLKAAWPLAHLRRPWVVALQTWLPPGPRGWLQRLALRRATVVCCSRATACQLRQAAVVIPNSYDDEVFRRSSGQPRDRDIVFVGRLIEDKGVDVLLRAVSKLRSRNLCPTLSIIGDGPEAERLKASARDLGLTRQVEFSGPRTPGEVAAALNRHRVLVVPSLWNEPFGIVALEGIACGCVVVGSSGGGLPEAIGPCGVTFPNGDDDALAACLADLLRAPDIARSYLENAPAHLQRHFKTCIAKAYLDVLSSAVRSSRARDSACGVREAS